jgi:hypothetical protein
MAEGAGPEEVQHDPLTAQPQGGGEEIVNPLHCEYCNRSSHAGGIEGGSGHRTDDRQPVQHSQRRLCCEKDHRRDCECVKERLKVSAEVARRIKSECVGLRRLIFDQAAVHIEGWRKRVRGRSVCCKYGPPVPHAVHLRWTVLPATIATETAGQGRISLLEK